MFCQTYSLLCTKLRVTMFVQKLLRVSVVHVGRACRTGADMILLCTLKGCCKVDG